MNYPNKVAAQLDDQSPQTFEGFDLPGDEPLDLSQYWRPIVKHKWAILGLALMSALLASLIAFNMKPIYRATATILLESQPAKYMTGQEAASGSYYDPEYFQTQFEILKSRSLALMVVDKLDLANRAAFQPKQDTTSDSHFNWRDWLPFELPPTKEQTAAAPTNNDPLLPIAQGIQGGIVVAPRKNTYLVDLSYDSEDPNLSKQVVDAVAEAYIETNLETRIEQTTDAAGWLSKRIDKAHDSMVESERKLQEYMEKENLVDLQGILTLSGKEIETGTQQLVEARNARIAAEILYKKVSEVDLENNIEAIPEIFQDSVVQDLKQKETEAAKRFAEIDQRYGPNYPAYITAQADLESVKAQVRRQITSLVNTIRRRYEVARANEASLDKTIEQNKGDIQTLGRKETHLQALKHEIETNRNLYEMFLTRFRETTDRKETQTANARFVDKALVPTAPYKPDKKKIVVMTFMASLLLGFVLAYIRERLDNTLKSFSDVESKLGIPLLGMTPVLKSSDQRLTLEATYLDRDRSLFVEGVRTVRTGVVLSTLDCQHKVILVTSTVAGEGKSTFSSALAASLGQTDKCLIIEADLRRPSLKHIFGILDSRPGLTHYLSHRANLDDCIFHYAAAKVDVMLAGLVPTDPLEILSSRAFGDFLSEIKKSYSTIVIDSPPIQVVSDAQILAQYADAIVFVAQPESTPVEAIRSGIKRLRAGNQGTFIGLVLNKVDPDATGYYDEYYYKYGYASREEDIAEAEAARAKETEAA
jgi:polysaccharide biosynthesis transport protein